METMLAGLEFATANVDSILLRSENNEQHRKHIKAVFQKMDEYGFKLVSEKCELFMKQITCLEQIIDKNGKRPDPESAEAIKNMLSLNNVNNLRAFWGLANNHYINIPKMYDLRAPLNDLLKKGRKWIWSKECQAAFQEIKSC